MTEYRTAQNALSILPEFAASKGMKDYQPCPEGVAWAEYHAGRKYGAKLVTLHDPDYPSHLSDISNAPPLLWIKGNMEVFQKPRIALVGARNASSLGTRMTRTFAGGLAEAGYVVVSGLARGVDTVAHHSTMDTGTIAVQAGGIDIMYPAENVELAQQITQNGARISEQAMGLTPQARHFPTRNRIISGLCQAVVVIEAAAKSGTLITARQALDQGRDVMAVPGHPIDARADGCNMLIRDGATLVRRVQDIVDNLEPVMPHPATYAPSPPPQMFGFAEPQQPMTLNKVADLHKEILDRLGPSPIAEDQIIRDLKSPASAVSPAIVELELLGQIERHSGGLISKVSPH